MKLYIKNMISNCCKMVVKEELEKLGLRPIVVDLGEVEIVGNISPKQRERFKMRLARLGLELLDDYKNILIGKIKNEIIKMAQNTDEKVKVNVSTFLSEKLQYDYTYLANLFSKDQGTSIRNFLILHKIERIKELISYNELNINEIAYKMNYSNVAHLSNQFKKYTGFTPTSYKELKGKKRIPIEEIENMTRIRRNKLPIRAKYNNSLQQSMAGGY